MADKSSELDMNATLQRIVDMAFKSNGAGLTVAAVAASNIVPSVTLSGRLAILPSILFLAGLIAAYLATMFLSLHDLHLARSQTLFKLRKQITDFEYMENPSEELSSMHGAVQASAAEISGQLLTKAQLSLYRTVSGRALNASMIFFVLGVVCALLLIAVR